MFEKKEIIFSETLGVCQVAELARLSAKNGEQILYYGLRSVYDRSKVSYIPVEHHQVNLRPLISYDKARELSGKPLNYLNELEKREIEYVLANPI
ncbi:MAG: CarD-like/TRCF domain protein [Lachnospiraceae bacterium]|nr:CarD-like/TRCF domain protein [Lachnospiraceae bacterium]